MDGCSMVKIETKMRGRTVKYLLRVINIVIVRGRLVPLRITCHQILGYSSARDQVRRKQGVLVYLLYTIDRYETWYEL